MYQTCNLDLIREFSLERLQWPASLVLEFLLACALSVMCQGWENKNEMQSVVFRVLRVVFIFFNTTPSISKYLQVLRTCKLFDSWARLRLPRSTGIDSARGLSCGLLFLVGNMERLGTTERLASFRVFSSEFDFRQVAIAEFLVGVTSQASSHWDSHRKMAESHSSLEQFEHKDVPVKPIKLKIAQSWEYPQDSQDPARKRLRFYWFYEFHVELSTQRRSWRNPRNLRALKVLVLLLLSSPWVTSPVEFDARTTILM